MYGLIWKNAKYLHTSPLCTFYTYFQTSLESRWGLGRNPLPHGHSLSNNHARLGLEQTTGLMGTLKSSNPTPLPALLGWHTMGLSECAANFRQSNVGHCGEKLDQWKWSLMSLTFFYARGPRLFVSSGAEVGFMAVNPIPPSTDPHPG